MISFQGSARNSPTGSKSKGAATDPSDNDFKAKNAMVFSAWSNRKTDEKLHLLFSLWHEEKNLSR